MNELVWLLPAAVGVAGTVAVVLALASVADAARELVAEVRAASAISSGIAGVGTDLANVAERARTLRCRPARR